jgi:hypothetical protein
LFFFFWAWAVFFAFFNFEPGFWNSSADYLELVMQFGQECLHSVVWPIVAPCSLLNNLIEIRSDAMKIAVGCRRLDGGGEGTDFFFIIMILNSGSLPDAAHSHHSKS